MFQIEPSPGGNRLVLRPRGDWVVEEAARLEPAVASVSPGAAGDDARGLVIDLGEIGALDTAGAYLLANLEANFAAAGRAVEWRRVDPGRAILIERVRDTLAALEPPLSEARENPLGRFGRAVLELGADMREKLTIFGDVVVEAGRSIVAPGSFRGLSVAQQMDVAGVRAVPIIILMSLIVGGILAQQGAFQLRFFGAEIFTVDLVGILTLREIAAMLTAIMVAGRSGSAITAELGSMQMREEIDALRVMGLSPVNVLVLPRVIALVIALPMLTFIASLAMLVGGAFTLWFYVGISPTIFVTRLREAIDFTTLASGLLKAPFMALIIAVVACAEGMAVRGSAESLGHHTTASVVKAIFLVIVVDGLFAVFYGAIDF